MRARLAKAWESRAPRERAVIAVLAAMLGIALYLWLAMAAGQARDPLRVNVTQLRAQEARLAQQAIEYGHLRGAPATTASATDLRTLVQTRAAAAGLSNALVSIDAPDVDHVVVVFGAVPFTGWLDWVASLKFQQIRLDSCRIEALSAPGLISVTATLARSKPP